MAKNNAKIYGVEHKIDFMVGDYISMMKNLLDGYKQFKRSEIFVFLSPPWGGPNYIESDHYSIESLEPIGGKRLFSVITEYLTENIIMFLPRTTNVLEVSIVRFVAPIWH